MKKNKNTFIKRIVSSLVILLFSFVHTGTAFGVMGDLNTHTLSTSVFDGTEGKTDWSSGTPTAYNKITAEEYDGLVQVADYIQNLVGVDYCPNEGEFLSGIAVDGSITCEDIRTTCSNGEILKWNSTSTQWECDDDIYGTGGSDGVVTGVSLGVDNVLTFTRAGLGDLTVDLSSLDLDGYIAGVTIDGTTLVFTVNGASDTVLDLSSMDLGGDDDWTFIDDQAPTTSDLYTTTSGNVGIGTTGAVPSKLTVEGDAYLKDVLAVGVGSVANGIYTFASGTGAAMGDYSGAIGYAAQANGSSAVALGDRTTAEGEASFAAGQLSTTGDVIGAIAMGVSSVANSEGSIALGYMSKVLSTGAQGGVAIGNDAVVNTASFPAFSFGWSTEALGNSSFAIGVGTIASADNSMAIGRIATNDKATSILLSANGNKDLFVASDGDVGVGTDVPENKIHVVGGARITAIAAPATKSYFVCVDENGDISSQSGPCAAPTVCCTLSPPMDVITGITISNTVVPGCEGGGALPGCDLTAASASSTTTSIDYVTGCSLVWPSDPTYPDCP